MYVQGQLSKSLEQVPALPPSAPADSRHFVFLLTRLIISLGANKRFSKGQTANQCNTNSMSERSRGFCVRAFLELLNCGGIYWNFELLDHRKGDEVNDDLMAHNAPHKIKPSHAVSERLISQLVLFKIRDPKQSLKVLKKT